MLAYDDVAKITKKFNVLYVEDDENVASQMTQILTKLFKTTRYAKDGLDGYSQFLKDKPDLIITDIKMPNLDGIQMSAKIRHIDSRIPIIIASAYDEVSFLHDAIEIGITSYLTKPISSQNLLSAIFGVCSNLENERLAIEYKKEHMIAELNAREENAVSRIVDIIDAPIALTMGENITYVNNHFKELFSINNMQDFINSSKISFINSLTIKKEGYVSDIQNIELDLPVKIIIKTMCTKFYEVQKKKISICDNTNEIYLYMFYDVTKIETGRLMIEYQKNKLKNLNSLLSELFYKNIAKREQNELKSADAVENKKERTSSYSGLLSEEQREILDKSRTHKATALEYTAELDDDMIEEIVELKDIETETLAFMDAFACLKEKNDLKSALNLLKEYAVCINMLIEFEDVAIALKGLADFLLKLSSEKIDAYDRKIAMNINNIISDLRDWRINIFETKIANDIHYLDASLFSSCLQLQFELSDKQNTEPDDDLGLEFF